jgi:DNA-binding GntR family transcriptional regulator
MALSTFIRDDLVSRIRSGEIVDDDLTLVSLSARYDVSLTPVRSAVSELIDQGILSKDENRRLAIADRKTDDADKPAPPQPSPQPIDFFEQVADHLLRHSLSSRAVFLREEATAEQFNVSRSQMRNIFSRLAGEGLLTHIPRRGWEVRPFRAEDLDAFKEVRVMLEVGALKLARLRLVEEDLREFLAMNVVPESEDEPVQIDNRIHAYIIEKAQNGYISDFFDRQGRYYNLLAQWEKSDREESIVSVVFHRTIIEALIRRDWDAAEAALVEHILRAHQKLRDLDLSRLAEEGV